MADDDVQVRFGAAIAGLLAGIEQAKDAIQSLTAPITAIHSSFKELGEAAAAAFAVHEIADFVEKFANLGTQTERAATLLGTSASQIGGFSLLAQAAGGDLGEMTHAMERLGLALSRSDAGSGQAKAALDALGISARQLESLPLEGKMELLAQKFSVLKDGSEKDAIAMALLGRAGAEMIPIFNEGAGAMAEFQAMAERAGSSMSKDQLDAAHALHMGIIELGASWTGLSNTIATLFQPALSGIIKVTTDLIQSFRQSAASGGAMHAVLMTLEVAAQGISTAFSIAVAAIETAWEAIKLIYQIWGEATKSLGRLIKDALTFNWSDMSSAWGDFTASLQARAKTSADNMEGIMRNMMSEFKTIWGTGAEEQQKIEQTKTAHMAQANKDALKAVQEMYAGMVKAADDAYALVSNRIESELKLREITQSQATAQLLSALEARNQKEQAAYAADLAKLEQGTAAYTGELNKRKAAYDKYVLDRQKITEKASEEEAKEWKSAADQISGAINSQLRDILSGHESLKQALFKISGDIALKFIQDQVKATVEFLANKARELLVAETTEAGKTTATTAGAAVRSAAEVASGNVSILQTIANAIKSIFASAGQTSAEVTAATAPEAGPAAPAIGLAAGAATAAGALGLVASAEIGGYVVKGGLLQVHDDETVVPAKMSQPFRPGAGGGRGAGGGGNVAVNISAVDSRSVKRFFEDNAHHMIGALNKGVRRGAHLNTRTARA